MNCKNCNKETNNSSFCTSSCSATFNNKQKVKKNRDYHCIMCNKLCQHSFSKQNLFCSNICHAEYTFLNKTKILIEEGKIDSPKTLKNYLLKTRDCKCEICHTDNMWNNLPLMLQLDHIDGNSDNNFPINLRLICPNCHSQTDTFAGKSGKKKITKRNSYLRKFKGYEE